MYVFGNTFKCDGILSYTVEYVQIQCIRYATSDLVSNENCAKAESVTGEHLSVNLTGDFSTRSLSPPSSLLKIGDVLQCRRLSTLKYKVDVDPRLCNLPLS